MAWQSSSSANNFFKTARMFSIKLLMNSLIQQTKQCRDIVCSFPEFIKMLYCYILIVLKVNTTKLPWIGSVYTVHRSKSMHRQTHTPANSSGIHLTLPILAVLVWCHVVDAVGWRAVAGWAVRLWAGQRRHAGQTGQRLQSLWWVAAGSHACTGL